MSQRYRDEVEAACALARTSEPALDSLVAARGGNLSLHRRLAVGRREGRLLRFTQRDREIVRRDLERAGIDPACGLPESATSRTALAAHQRSEKRGARGIAADRALLALAPLPGSPPQIGGKTLCLPPGSHLVASAGTLSIDALDWLLTVENYETFLDFASTAPGGEMPPGQGVLVLRGSPAFPGGWRYARHLAESRGVAHWHAPDADPAGLLTAAQAGIAGVLLPAVDALATHPLTSPALFHDQAREFGALINRRDTFPGLAPWIDWMAAAEAAVTQESARAAALPLVWQGLG
ncbi:hypothetical protein J2T57_001539 [Natronocella acetinitrilica]|uniref:DUF2399 domain-containing protein n=1 Tax=Natronocella acetinitrilica TaxID=414046 RepID=A0AAE3KFT8_9GAMM|nr:hypothetical protein [Natronocella acetinitrilica]MCP1674437.1 hypothetical protein [Natronocella acetinitrilica]